MEPYFTRNWAPTVHCVDHNGRIITATEHWPSLSLSLSFFLSPPLSLSFYLSLSTPPPPLCLFPSIFLSPSLYLSCHLRSSALCFPFPFLWFFPFAPMTMQILHFTRAIPTWIITPYRSAHYQRDSGKKGRNPRNRHRSRSWKGLEIMPRPRQEILPLTEGALLQPWNNSAEWKVEWQKENSPLRFTHLSFLLGKSTARWLI